MIKTKRATATTCDGSTIMSLEMSGTVGGTKFQPLSFNENQDSDAFFDDECDGAWQDDTDDIENLLEGGELDAWNTKASGGKSSYDNSVPIPPRSYNRVYDRFYDRFYDRLPMQFCTKRNIHILAVLVTIAIVMQFSSTQEVDYFENENLSGSNNVSKSHGSDAGVNAPSASDTTSGWDERFKSQDVESLSHSSSEDEETSIIHGDTFDDSHTDEKSASFDYSIDNINSANTEENQNNGDHDMDTKMKISSVDSVNFDAKDVNMIENNDSSHITQAQDHSYRNHIVEGIRTSTNNGNNKVIYENSEIAEGKVASTQIDVVTKVSGVRYYSGIDSSQTTVVSSAQHGGFNNFNDGSLSNAGNDATGQDNGQNVHSNNLISHHHDESPHYIDPGSDSLSGSSTHNYNDNVNTLNSNGDVVTALDPSEYDGEDNSSSGSATSVNDLNNESLNSSNIQTYNGNVKVLNSNSDATTDPDQDDYYNDDEDNSSSGSATSVNELNNDSSFESLDNERYSGGSLATNDGLNPDDYYKMLENTDQDDYYYYE